ncbi:integrase, catalytic region, zinc finger, CCHC-type containing protein [Tanacetum coccineum]
MLSWEAGSKDRPPMLAPGQCPVPLLFNYNQNANGLWTLVMQSQRAEDKSTNPTNNNSETSSKLSRANQDNSSQELTEDWCYNCKEYGHVSRECQKPKRVKDAAYHKEKMLLCKQEEAGVQLNAEQADWKDDTDDESDDQELEAHYMYMAQIHEVTPDSVDNSGPIFDEPMHKVQNNNDNYNVFAMENEHPEQPESSNDIYLTEQGDSNITIDSSDICYDRAQDDQDETDDLDQERDLLASLIQKLKCEIDDSKNRNKFLESSNKELVDKLKVLQNLSSSRKLKERNDSLMLAPESDETIRLAKENRSKLSDLIKPFDYDKLNNLYDLFVSQREKSPEQHYFPRTSKMSHTSSNNEFSKETFHKQTTLLEALKNFSRLKRALTRFLMELNVANKQSLKEHILVT